MNKVTIGFSTHGGFFSWLIRFSLGTKYSHVYIKFHSKSFEEYIIYQASGLAVNMVGEEVFLKKNKVVAEKDFELEAAAYKSMIKFAISKCGLPYGIKQLFGMAWIKFCSMFGFKVRNPFPSSRANYICSEVVAEILKTYKDVNFTHLDSLDPSDIYRIIMKDGI